MIGNTTRLPEFYSAGDDSWTTSDGTVYTGLIGNFNVFEWVTPPEDIPAPVYPGVPEEGFDETEAGRAAQAEYEAKCAECEAIEKRISGTQLESADQAVGHLREAIDAGFELLRLNLRPGVHHVRRIP